MADSLQSMLLFSDGFWASQDFTERWEELDLRRKQDALFSEDRFGQICRLYLTTGEVALIVRILQAVLERGVYPGPHLTTLLLRFHGGLADRSNVPGSLLYLQALADEDTSQLDVDADLPAVREAWPLLAARRARGMTVARDPRPPAPVDHSGVAGAKSASGQAPLERRFG